MVLWMVVLYVGHFHAVCDTLLLSWSGDCVFLEIPYQLMQLFWTSCVNAVAGYDDPVGRLLLLVVLAEDYRTHCSWFETSVWGEQQYFDGNWIVEQLWLICLLSTYPKLGCDHYYSDGAFLKPNKNYHCKQCWYLIILFTSGHSSFKKRV